MADDGHTIVIPGCDVHPPYAEWPNKNLIRGWCPRCSHSVGDDPKLLRELRARRLIADLDKRAV